MDKILAERRSNVSCDMILFRRELFYLVAGCTLLMEMHWLREKVLFKKSSEKASH
jgi:hypothetical protein